MPQRPTAEGWGRCQLTSLSNRPLLIHPDVDSRTSLNWVMYVLTVPPVVLQARTTSSPSACTGRRWLPSATRRPARARCPRSFRTTSTLVRRHVCTILYPNRAFTVQGQAPDPAPCRFPYRGVAIPDTWNLLPRVVQSTTSRPSRSRRARRSVAAWSTSMWTR